MRGGERVRKRESTKRNEKVRQRSRKRKRGWEFQPKSSYALEGGVWSFEKFNFLVMPILFAHFSYRIFLLSFSNHNFE